MSQQQDKVPPVPTAHAVDPAAPPKEAEDNRSVHEGSPDVSGKRLSPWAWIPTANFSSGLPYHVVNTLSRLVFKNMGVGNTAITFWTGLLMTPWTLKPFWGPLVDRYGSKRDWIVGTQLLLAIGLLVSALALKLPNTPLGKVFSSLAEVTWLSDLPLFFLAAIFILFIMAIASATYDIACDGYYMIALRKKQQSFFVGIRSSFYRAATLLAGGLLPLAAGYIQGKTGPEPVTVTINVLAALPEPETVEDVLAEIVTPEADDTEAQTEESATEVAEAPEVPAAPTLPVPPDDLTFLEPANPDELSVLVSSTTITQNAGIPATFWIRLNRAPPEGEEVVAITTQREGNRWITLQEDSERIPFTSENWDQPRLVTIKLDERLPAEEKALYMITAGNIPFSWAVVFATSGIVFLLIAGYHYIILPRPFEDEANKAAAKPSIWRPIFWLGVSVAVVIAVVSLFGMGFERLFLEGYHSLVGHEGLPDGKKKAFGVLFGTLKYFTLGLIIFGILQIPGVKSFVSRTFFRVSEESGINFADVYVSFFQKKAIAISIAFILLFRLGESQIVALGQLFLVESRDRGGLGLTIGEVGLIYNGVGVACLASGGIIGGLLISWLGIRKAIWPLVAAMHLPNLLYVLLAVYQPTNFWVVTSYIAIEQLGYGIGFASFMMVLIIVAQGPFKTSHYAICTGFMSLGMQIPMMLSGAFQEAFGYVTTFVLACVLVIPGVLLIPFLPLEGFDKKTE